MFFIHYKNTLTRGKKPIIVYLCKMSAQILRAGQLLCSKPYIDDPFFERTVILITRHNQRGTEGVILNQPIEIENLEDIGIIGKFTSVLFLGGPVTNNRCYYLHRCPELLPNSESLSDNLYFGGDVEILEHLINTGILRQTDIRFYIGISGWEPGQLQRELNENTWFIEDARPYEWICRDDISAMWHEIISAQGHPYSLYAQGPENPEHN